MTVSTAVGLTAMHHLHLELGAKMVEEEGWQRPVVYSTVDEEVERLRGAAGLTDISPDGKISLQGSSMGGMVGGALFEAHSGEELGTGECVFVAAPERPDAPAVLLARLASDEMVAFTGPSEREAVHASLSGHDGPTAQAVDLTSALAGAAITGPSAALVLSSVSGLDTSPDNLPDMGCAQGEAAGVHGIFLRADRGGMPGYRLYFGREYGEYVWEALLDAGREYGAAPVGTEALARLRWTGWRS